MVKKLIILVGQYLDRKTLRQRIGGVETYMNDLAILAANYGAEVVIYEVCQKRAHSERLKLINYYVDFYETGRKVSVADYQKAFDTIFIKENGSNVLFVISTDQLHVQSDAYNVIQIQHGISFDAVGYEGNNIIRRSRFFQRLFKLWICFTQSKMFYHTRNTICVD